MESKVGMGIPSSMEIYSERTIRPEGPVYAIAQGKQSAYYGNQGNGPYFYILFHTASYVSMWQVLTRPTLADSYKNIFLKHSFPPAHSAHYFIVLYQAFQPEREDPAMRTKIYLVSALVVIAGCAPYRQLKPKPELTPQEQGYIELKHDKKDFDLKKNKRYFFAFPKPQQDNFYLVLSVPDKKKIGSFLTAQLVDNKKPGPKIRDESPYPDTVYVFGVDTKSPQFYWLIDNVPADMVLKVNYRYAPQWRYKFETSYSRFKATLKKNLVDRTLYGAIGVSAHLESFNYQLVMDTVAKHTAELEKVHKELLAIESIFPASILNSTDEAYKNYLALRKELEEEIAFQKNFHSVIDIFNKEYQCRGNTLQFMDRVDDFSAFFGAKDQYPANVIQEAKTVIGKRLDEVQPAYEKRLAAKEDSKPLDSASFRLPALNKVPKLYESAGLSVPPDLPTLVQFADDFDAKARANLALRDSLGRLAKFVQEIGRAHV
jgi:hypothetical protein